MKYKQKLIPNRAPIAAAFSPGTLKQLLHQTLRGLNAALHLLTPGCLAQRSSRWSVGNFHEVWVKPCCRLRMAVHFEIMTWNILEWHMSHMYCMWYLMWLLLTWTPTARRNVANNIYLWIASSYQILRKQKNVYIFTYYINTAYRYMYKEMDLWLWKNKVITNIYIYIAIKDHIYLKNIYKRSPPRKGWIT